MLEMSEERRENINKIYVFHVYWVLYKFSKKKRTEKITIIGSNNLITKQNTLEISKQNSVVYLLQLLSS